MEAISSSWTDNGKYDVFLSFRGEDTRNNFLSHLYEALNAKGIITFKDDKELERGKSIEPSLFEAIENSTIALVVFSPNYASSPWCLDELIEIVRCKETKEQIILPVFFKVDPSNIEMQSGILEEVFSEYKKKFEDRKIQSWRDALSTVATISGWHTESFLGSEADLVRCIVNNISDRLICDGLYFEHELVGIDVHMEEMDKLLNLDVNDVRIVGIWGPGGIGKTTIADFVYHKHFDKFDACYRLECKRKGSTALQKEFISQFPLENHMNIWDVNSGCSVIHKRLRGKKILLVLDDVDEVEQLKALANVQLFGRGSRIIITTRDEHLFAPYTEKYIYEVPLLEKDQALQLFSIHAFGKNQPPNDFLELSMKFESYAHGLPLVLKVLGAHLCGRLDMVFWRSELEKLKVIPNAKIHRVLKLSFDGLDDYLVKEVFLDIAFFFTGQSKISTEKILHQCCFHPESAFTILKEKALLTIKDGILCMHEIIQGMAREIVREESGDNPNERSRLCEPIDVRNVLTNGQGTRTQGISLDMSKISSIRLEPDTFKRMYLLRILKFYMHYCSSYTRQPINFARDLDFLPNSLTYIHWDLFPFKSLPSTFSGENLVELTLQHSTVECLWRGDVELVNLRTIDLNFSKCLKTVPDLSKAVKIEKISLRDCEKFTGFINDDFQHLHELYSLDLSRCTDFHKLPSRLPPNLTFLHLTETAIEELPSGTGFLTKLKQLRLDGCKNISTLPIEIGALESLQDFSLSRSGIKELPSAIQFLTNLRELHLENCKKISTLPTQIGALKSLKYLHLQGSGIKELPSEIQFLTNLYSLQLDDCEKLSAIPKEIGMLDLEVLDLRGTSVKELPESIGHMKFLRFLRLTNIKEFLQSIVGLKSLSTLDLEEGSMIELPESIGHLHNLGELKLNGCAKLVRLPSCLHQLSSLFRIEIRDCKSLYSLPELPSSIQIIEAVGCDSLEKLPNNGCWSHLKRLEKLNFTNCSRLDPKACREILKQFQAILLHYYYQEQNPLGFLGLYRLPLWYVPGNEIPDWCQYRSCESSSVTIKLPSCLHQLKEIVLAFVFGPENPQDPPVHSDGIIWLNYTIYDNTDNPLSTLRFDLQQCVVDHVFLRCVDFKHSLLGIQLRKNLGRDVRIDFQLEDRPTMVLKKCGVYLITEEECIGSESTDEDGIRSSSDSHDQRHRDNFLFEMVMKLMKNAPRNGDEVDEECSKRRKITHMIE